MGAEAKIERKSDAKRRQVKSKKPESMTALLKVTTEKDRPART
jgi:hypothetical protein